MLQKEFPPKVEWFAELTVKLDLGFQGFSDIYCCKKLVIPIKKKRAKKGVKNELTSQELEHNKAVGSQRIFVEHAIGGMKRYRILEHRNRLKSTTIINQVIGVCAALWNFYLITR
jgi:DDE superfamily endonuclease